MKTSLPLVLALTFALTATPAMAEPEGAAEARDVIQSQIDAFGAEDVESAYAFAAPMIQRKFGDPETFGAMVRGGYPMVWDPSDIEFLDAEAADGLLIQRLRIVDRAGQPYIAEYRLKMIDGAWRIAGVMILKDESYGV